MINKKVKNRILKRVAKGESTLDAIADEFGVSKRRCSEDSSAERVSAKEPQNGPPH